MASTSAATSSGLRVSSLAIEATEAEVLEDVLLAFELEV
jgi:hypothetical protein